MDSKHNLVESTEVTKTYLGFWIYIMTDCVLFASLFAVYAVLHHNTNGGPGSSSLFSMPNALAETLILLTSSFTSGLSMIAARNNHKVKVIYWLVITFLLGAAFLFLEIHEFQHLVITGDSWRRSGFLSSYFTLVGTHGLHIAVGLFWMAIISLVILKRGLTKKTVKGLTLLNLFWHFLDVIWIFIFSVVYLMGHVGL
ncbi:MAG: cytochrome o ubiquinol oxidase subunit III [Candidatus Saccharibacteria bacterium]